MQLGFILMEYSVILCYLQRLQHIENESSKNVSMMQSNFEKLENVEREKGKFVKELEEAHLKLAAVDKNYNVELERNRQMAQILTQKEIELNEVVAFRTIIATFDYKVLVFRTKMICKMLGKKYCKVNR